MLKKLRVGISVILFALITFYFLDFAALMPDRFHVLAHIQFIPAIAGKSFIILATLIVLTLAFGRVYCSSVCPMGIYQDIVAWISKKTAKKKKRYKFSKARNVLRWSVAATAFITFFAGYPALLGLVDPYSAYGRIIANVFRPVYMAGNTIKRLILEISRYYFYIIYNHLVTKIEFLFQKPTPIKRESIEQLWDFCFCLLSVFRMCGPVTAQNKSKWLVKCIRTTAAIVENAFVLSDLV
jgi:hypothetical protein